MKIQCDVCCKEEASVFCAADEAALCLVCDYQVHNANKLASQHSRTWLVRFHDKPSPPCDTCKENRGLLFCREHRAVVCINCDISIHKANKYTNKHNRFLLTKIELSQDCPLSTQDVVSSCSATSTNNESNSIVATPEFLMEKTWQVEDLLDSTYTFGSKEGLL